MDMSFLEVGRRAAMARPGPREDQRQPFAPSPGIGYRLPRFHSNEMLERDSSACAPQNSGSQGCFLEATPFESESLTAGLSSAPFYQTELEDLWVKRRPPRHIRLVQEGRREERHGVCETTSWKQNLALGKS